MTERATGGRLGTLVRRFRWIWLAPVLAVVTLSSWAFASPVGAGPDDDYHLVSTWCANGGSEQCEPGETEATRVVPSAFRELTCFVQVETRSAACQEPVWESWAGDPWETVRGNFAAEYPPVFYGTMRLFAGDDIQISSLAMRVFNAVLFVTLATALAVLLPGTRQRALLWGWLVTLVPLGLFIVASNNPSGWAVTGVGTAFLALLGWFETTGRRRWGLAALYIIGIVMAAGARGDAAIYAAGATATAVILSSERTRAWLRRAILPAVGFVVILALFFTSRQAGIGATGFSGGGTGVIDGEGGSEVVLSGFSLLAYNLLMLPSLWTGVWGSWALGWLDTHLPAIVQWSATAAFIVVGFAGLGRLTWRKAIATSGVLIVLVVLPVYVLTVGGDKVGAQLQPRYLLPLVVLFAFLLVTERVGDDTMRFTRLQTFAIVGALAIANLVSLQVNLRRYVTGADQQGLNLDAGAEWWWTGFPVGPSVVWIVG